MEITKNSELLFSYLSENRNISFPKQNKKSNDVLKELYDDIFESYTYLMTIKNTKKNYKINFGNIINVNQIPKPKMYNVNSFPSEIKKYIDETTGFYISYTFSLFAREIKVFFIEEELSGSRNFDLYEEYISKVTMWLYILNNCSSNKCSKKLNIYIYLTKLEKKLPASNLEILNEYNVNTAFTTTCPTDSEIVIFRKEEWFKVLIHETFHNFGLDFSDMNNDYCKEIILSIFDVDSHVNLYEAYSEFWAEIMNSLFCSFFLIEDKTNVNEFLNSICKFLIESEINYSFFQMNKVLNFMGLKYEDMYSKENYSKMLRETLYKENTNVLAYYVIKTILLNNYTDFLVWCKKNNNSILQFKKTSINLKHFCEFIKNRYKTKRMLENVRMSENFLNTLRNRKKTKELKFILSTLRMSICEMI